MSLKSRLPQELLRKIFEYDNTYKDINKDVCRQIWEKSWLEWSQNNVQYGSEVLKFAITGLLLSNNKCLKIKYFQRQHVHSDDIYYISITNIRDDIMRILIRIHYAGKVICYHLRVLTTTRQKEEGFDTYDNIYSDGKYMLFLHVD